MSEKIARVAYRFDTSPATYDFLQFLAIVEDARRQQDIDKIVLALVPGRRGWSDRDKLISQAQLAWRTERLVPELATLLPSCIAVGQGDPEKDQQTVPYSVTPVPYGAYLDCPDFLLHLIPFNEPYITLTVRQSWFQKERDTKADWNEIIPNLGLPVVVVPDTEAEMQGRPCIITAGKQYHAAAFSPRLRFALYKKARLNLFTSGGAGAMACFSNLNAELFGLYVPAYKTCDAPHLMNIGQQDGARVQNTRFHWSSDADTILTAVKERL